jgi:Receptor family ligand binding region.
MKKTIKRLSMLLVGVIAASLLLSGCTKNTSASSSDKINVGALFELTGQVASYGTSEYNAVKLYIDDTNKNGGVLGKQINLIKADNKSATDESINQATKLVVENNVVAILGPATTGNTKAASSIALSKNIPLITPSGTSLDVTVDTNTNKVKSEIFRACYTDPYQGKVMGEVCGKRP